MPNSFWFFALLISSLILFCSIIYKKRNTQTLFLYLTMVGYGYIIETMIFNFLGSYDYKPNIIKHDSFYDSELGAFFSNALSLPITATLIATFHLNWLWIVIFSGYFVGIEWFFLKLHIYTHHWWRLEYTGLGLVMYFVLAKIFYKWILLPSQGLKHNLMLYLITGSISASCHILPMLFFLNRYYRPNWFDNVGRDSIAFSALYYLCASLYYCLIVKINWKTKWKKYILTGLFFYIVNQFLIMIGILHSLVWWDQMYYVFLSLFLIMLVNITDKRLSSR
ncbi:hypothetical protein ASG89_23460 [Paenibacillus sp. Soil766]|uniref:hypothetical protein n=1 Tax=Paenibacillus sp. Soil766 TaxID=1736404 RepID=UPI000710DD58|nr:hypothetical protein [Paenibacillus sp. Soil766]KRF03398.1 hypothetical protein ASG89_23460 [Paenibacillus sp. Soil766]